MLRFLSQNTIFVPLRNEKLGNSLFISLLPSCSCGGRILGREIAEEGLKELEKWMREIGVSLSLAELGVKEEMFEGIANATFIIPNDFHTLTHEEVVEILEESM